MLLISHGSAAWAGVGVDLVGAGTYSKATTSAGTPDSKFGFPGGGMILNFNLSSHVKLELGGLYLTRTYTTFEEQKTRMLEGLLGFKFQLSRALFINLGGYLNHMISSPEGITDKDIGAYGGIGLKIPFGSSVALLLNPQYRYAFNKLNTSGGFYTVTPHEFVGIVGLSFGMNRLK
jgi:hypothetical protein